MKLKKISIIFLIVVCAVLLAYSAVEYINIPERFTVIDDEPINDGKIFSAEIEAGDTGILKNGVYQSTQKKEGTYSADVKMFGILNVKKVEVDVIKNKKVIACGNSIGVKLYTDGVLVVELTDVETKDNKKISPAKNAGIKEGDFIKKLNGEKITNIQSLKEAIERAGEKEVKISYLRSGKMKDTVITPVISKDGGLLRLGMWVKDSTAGIGTMTYYDPQTKCFGALGHGISSEEGDVLSVLNGSVVKSSIIDVKKGKAGEPGELQGLFLSGNSKIGSIKKNIKYGIFGTVENDSNLPKDREFYIGTADKIKEGKAYILSNIADDGVKQYEIEIQKIMLYNENSTKGMVIKVTDENLIKMTGGIVQGMSGSPIIQDNLIVGAVTHVFVNDPTKGYGIFIETMIKNGL